MNKLNKKVFLAIAAIILVAISVVALVYTYDHSAPAGSVNIQSVSIVPGIDPRIGDLTVVLSNNGSTEITGVSVVSFNGSPVTNGAMTLSPSPLAPEQTGYATFSITSSSSFIAGQTYSLVLSITFANNANQLITTTVTVSAS